MQLRKDDRFVCVFALCFLADMSQQAKNAAMKSQKDNISYRSCLISIAERHDMKYDIVKNDRYHYKLQRMWQKMNAQTIKTAKAAFDTLHDLIQSDSINRKTSLKTLALVLNLILIRFLNSAHAKYDEMIKQLHDFFMKTMLHERSWQAYIAQLQAFSSSTEWNHLQSSLHHLRSYTLFDHARWFIIISSLLRCWLREEHIQLYFHESLQRVFAQDLLKRSLTDVIVSEFALNVKSISLLMSSWMKKNDRTNFSIIINQSRVFFQSLCEVVAVDVTLNSRSRQSSFKSVKVSTAKKLREKNIVKLQLNTTTELDATLQRAELIAQASDVTNSNQKKRDAIFLKSKTFRSLKTRLNLHIDLHYKNLLQKYAIFSNCNVLIDEQKHRWVFSISKKNSNWQHT